MRILRLDLGLGIGTVDLHPFISVLHGMNDAQVETLMSTIRTLANGTGERRAELSGLLEHAGELVEIGAPHSPDLGPMTTEDVVIDIDELVGPGAADAGAKLAELERRAEIDAVRLEEIRADLDSTVAARVFSLRRRLGYDTDPESAAVAARIGRIDEELSAVRTISPTLVEVPDEVTELISAWERYSEKKAEAAPMLDALSARIQAAEVGLARAQEAARAAEADAQPLMLDPAEDARLEELVNPTTRKRRTHALAPEAQAEVDGLLAKVDMPSYTAYVMHRLSPTPPADKVKAHQDALTAVLLAENEVQEARYAMSVDPVNVELDEMYETVRAEAQVHLGPMLPQDLGAALAEMVVEVENPVWLEGLRGLYSRLLEEGVAVPDDISPEQLTDWVVEWVDEARAALVVDESEDPEVLEAALSEAEAVFARHNRALMRIDHIEAEAMASMERVRALRVLTGSGDGEVGGIRSVIERANALASTLRSQSSVSVPIVLHGDLTAVSDREVEELMQELEPLAQNHQIVLATANDRAAEWATQVGLRRALRSSHGSAAASPHQHQPG